jgi:hypothetical protein
MAKKIDSVNLAGHTLFRAAGLSREDGRHARQEQEI